GGSSQVLPHRVTHPLASIADRFAGHRVVHEPGCLTHKFLPELPAARLGPDASESGAATDDDRPIHLTVFPDPTFGGEPVAERRLRTLQARLFTGTMPGIDDAATFGARYEATFVPRRSGHHQFGVCAVGRSRVLVDGEVVADNWTPARPGQWLYGFGTD